MKSCNNVVKYDHWSYLTMLGSFGVVFIALRQGIGTDRQLFGILNFGLCDLVGICDLLFEIYNC